MSLTEKHSSIPGDGSRQTLRTFQIKHSNALFIHNDKQVQRGLHVRSMVSSVSLTSAASESPLVSAAVGLLGTGLCAATGLYKLKRADGAMPVPTVGEETVFEEDGGDDVTVSAMNASQIDLKNGLKEHENVLLKVPTDPLKKNRSSIRPDGNASLPNCEKRRIIILSSLLGIETRATSSLSAT